MKHSISVTWFTQERVLRVVKFRPDIKQKADFHCVLVWGEKYIYKKMQQQKNMK